MVCPTEARLSRRTIIAYSSVWLKLYRGTGGAFVPPSFVPRYYRAASFVAFRRLCACVCDAAPRGPSAPLHTRSRTQSQTPDDSSMTDRIGHGTRDSGRHTRAARARARGGVADEHAASRKRKTQKKRKTVRYGKPIIDGPEPDTTRLGSGNRAYTLIQEGTWTYIGPPAPGQQTVGASGLAFCCGNVQDCGHTRIDGQAQQRGRMCACVCVSVCCVCRCARVVAPLLPRMKASPYLALSCPFTYSSVCSIAMFMKPSRHASTPVRRLASSACAKRSRARRHATSVVHARVELDHHRPSKHLLEELRRVVLRGGRGARHRCWSWSVGGELPADNARDDGPTSTTVSRQATDSASQVPTLLTVQAKEIGFRRRSSLAARTVDTSR